MLKAARKSVVMKQEGLVVGNRKTMLTNRGQATGGDPERELPQRRELVPFFGRISQDPFNCACFIIDSNDKIFPARNDHRVIRAIIGNSVVMKPVVIGLRCPLKDELTGIISPGPHRCADNISQIPCL